MRRRGFLALAGAAGLAASSAAQGRPHVVASFSILGDFVREVAGDGVQLTTFVGPDQDAHVYEPTPADARVLASAAAVVVNGLGFEGWLDRLVRASGFKGARIVASEGVKTLRAPGRRGHAHGHGHGHGHGSIDPHVWQDPRRVQDMVRAIARGLGKVDPERAENYRQRSAGYVAQLVELEATIAADIAAVPKERRKVVSSHDAFAYFQDRFGVAFRAPHGISTDSEPSAADIGRLIREIRREKVRIVFIESISNPRLIEQIAKESGAQMGGRLYSDALSGPSGPAPTYIAMMRHNAARLRDAMIAE